MSRTGLLLAACVCLVLANALPAFWLAGDMAYGFQATCLGFVAILMAGKLEAGQFPAAVLGVIANLGYLAAIVAVLGGSRTWAKGIAVTSAAAAVGSVAFLATGAERFIPNIGCGLWLATAGLLVLAATTPASARNENV